MTWKNQIKLKKMDNIPSPTELKYLIADIDNDRNKALISILYLTAGRISEVMALKRSFISMDDEFYVIKMPNRKHKKRFWKEIPISPYKPIDMYFFQIFMDYANNNPRGLIFDIMRDTARKMITKATGFNPHWFRHIRLSHLRRYYKFDGFLLKNYAGWTDIKQAKSYIEIGIDDFKDKLK